MAVHIDVPAFRSSIPAEVVAAAERLLQGDGIGDLEAVGGGARAVVDDDGVRFQSWVGVVDRALAGDCDCAGRADEDGLCVHAVAVALLALEAGVKFSAAGRPHGPGPVEPDRAEFLTAVQRLGPRELTELVVEQAVQDPLFATVLLARAGMLDPADESGSSGSARSVRSAKTS